MEDVIITRRATTSEAVIKDARRRQRRRRLGIGCVCLAVLTTIAIFTLRGRGAGGDGAASAGGNHVTPARAAACLRQHDALVQMAPPIRDFGRVPTIAVSFAVVPGQRQDELTISFARDAAAAHDAVAGVVGRFEGKVPRFKNSFLVEHNAIVFWQAPHPTAASRATVRSCL